MKGNRYEAHRLKHLRRSWCVFVYHPGNPNPFECIDEETGRPLRFRTLEGAQRRADELNTAARCMT